MCVCSEASPGPAASLATIDHRSNLRRENSRENTKPDEPLCDGTLFQRNQTLITNGRRFADRGVRVRKKGFWRKEFIKKE